MDARSVERGSSWFRRLRRRVVPGAVDGFRVWAAYGLLEAIFTLILPAFLPVGHDPVPLDRWLVLLLVLVYGVVGACVTGALQALLGLAESTEGSSGPGARALPLLPLLTLAAACGVDLLFQPGAAGTREAYGVCAFVLAVSLASILSEDAARRLRFASQPLCVVVLLLAVPWAAAIVPPSAARYRSGLAAAAFAAVLLVFALTARWRSAAWPGGVALWRGSLRTLGILALVGVVATSGEMRAGLREDAQPPPLAGTSQPNVVLVVMDTVRADHLSLYGYSRPTSPRLEALARRATLFTHAISAASMTLSSHASIFTGLYARRHGAHYDLPQYPGGRRLPAHFETLAEILFRHGYATLGVAANYGYLGPGFGLDRGFEYYDSRTATPLLRATMPFFLRQGTTELLARFLPPCARDRTTRRADDVDAEAFRLIDKSAGRPFFLFLNYMDAHSPYCPPPPFDTRFPGRLPRFSNADYVRLEKAVLSGRRQVPAAVREDLISQYDGGIAYLDQALGRLVAHLEARGLLDRTLLIITADHGEAFGRRGLIEHGVSVYQDQVHVPLLIHFPHQERGKVVPMDVSLVDLMPTALEVAGLPVPPGLSGRSLLHAAALRDRPIFTESYPNGYLVSFSGRFHRTVRAVLEGPRKLIVATAGRRALFDLSQDPREERNVLRQGQSAPRLRTRLDEWLRRTRPAGDPTPLDPDVLRRLRELGYVQ